MAGLSIVPFLGVMPRTASRLLPPGLADDATNVNLDSGEIRPIKTPLLVNTPVVAGPWLGIYRAEYQGAQKWLAWARDVDVVRSALPSAVEPRFYITGDGEPRYARFQDLPATVYALGVPRPQAAPSVAHSGGTGAAVTRVYAYTFYTALDEEGPESPASALVTGKVDGTWAITGMDAFPANSGTGTTVAAAGVSTFTNTGNHWLRVGDEVVIAGQTVAVSAVTSPAVFQVPGTFTGATAWARKAPWNTAGMKRRLYRSEGTTGSFQLVALDVGTSYDDTLTAAQIPGDELISSTWEAPPPGLRGIRSLPNGSIVGFLGTQVCYSEPFQGHAWPEAYRRACDFEVVAVESYGTTVVAATAGTPYVLTGTEPANVTPEAISEAWPCLSKRSMVSIGNGVLFATTHGLAYVGLGEPAIWTAAYFTREEWRPLNPASMVAVETEGRVYVRYEGVDGERAVLVFNRMEQRLTRLSFLDHPTELYADERNGQLYLADTDGIKLYDAGEGIRLNYSWRSKEYNLPRPLNLAAAKVDFVGEMSPEDVAAAQAEYDAAVAANEALVAAYRGAGGINGSFIQRRLLNGSDVVEVAPLDVARLTFTLYVDDVAVFSTGLVADQRAFRLPEGYKSANVAVGLTGAVRVKKVVMAESMLGLKDL